MDIEIKVDLGYDEKRDQFYLADFEVKTDDQTQSRPQAKSSRKPRLRPSTNSVQKKAAC